MVIPPIEILAAIGIVIFFAIGLHEYAHCKFADMAGDPTPAYYGRVTLDLTKHFEPVGTLMMVITQLTGFGIGWGRPAPINPAKMNNPRWDSFVAVLAGPVSNVLQAMIFGFVMRILFAARVISVNDVFNAIDRQPAPFLAALVGFGVITNLGLFAFNMIPFGRLDGHWIVGLLMPDPYRTRWFQFQRQAGDQILIAVILISQFANLPLLGLVIGPVVRFFFKLLTGIPI